jgi:hypothetical protein
MPEAVASAMRNDIYPSVIGAISLWRYRENVGNYLGWHLSADEQEAESLHSVLTALSSAGGYRTVPITKPTPDIIRVPNNRNGAAKWHTVNKWRIECVENDCWRFSEDAGAAILVVGGRYLSDLIAGVYTMGTDGDYCIGGDQRDELLWFWWQTRQA